MRDLLRKAAEKEGNQPKRKNCVAVNKDEKSWTLVVEMQSLEFAKLVFGITLFRYFLTITIWNGSVYPLMLEICDLLFDFIGDYS